MALAHAAQLRNVVCHLLDVVSLRSSLNSRLGRMQTSGWSTQHGRGVQQWSSHRRSVQWPSCTVKASICCTANSHPPSARRAIGAAQSEARTSRRHLVLQHVLNVLGQLRVAMLVNCLRG